jgi:hypothetical protein
MKPLILFLLLTLFVVSDSRESIREHAQSLFQKFTGKEPEPEVKPGFVEKVKDFASDTIHKVTGEKVDVDEAKKKASELKKHPSKENAEKLAEEVKPGIIDKAKGLAQDAIHKVTGEKVDVDEAAKKAEELKKKPSTKNAEKLAEEVKPGIIEKAKDFASDAIHKVTGEKVDVDEAGKKAADLKKDPSKKNAEKLAEEVKPGIIDKAKGLAQDAIHKVTGEKADVDEVGKKAAELKKHPSKENTEKLAEETGVINKMKGFAHDALHKVTGEDVDVDDAAKKAAELKKHPSKKNAEDLAEEVKPGIIDKAKGLAQDALHKVTGEKADVDETAKKAEELNKHPSKKNAEKLAEEVKPGVTGWVKDHVQGAYDKVSGKAEEKAEQAKSEGVTGWVKDHVQGAYDKVTGHKKEEVKKGIFEKVQDAAESFKESVTGVTKDAKDKLKK